MKNNFIKGIGVVVIILGLMFIGIPMTTFANSNKDDTIVTTQTNNLMKHLKPNTTYYIDVNGDGKKNSIMYKYNGDREDYLLTINLDNHLYYYSYKNDTYENSWDISVMTYSSSKKYLLVVGCDGDGNFFPRMYRYVNQNLKYIQSFTLPSQDKFKNHIYKYNIWADHAITYTDSNKLKILYKQDFSLIGGVYFSVNYKYSAGKYKITGNTYPVVNRYQNIGKVKQKIYLKKNISSKNSSIALAKGSSAKVTKIYISKRKVYAMIVSGTKHGWIRLDNQERNKWIFTNANNVLQ